MSIAGIQLENLVSHGDARGSVTEIFRAAWASVNFVQWNFVRSRAGVLRGVHGHFRHSDYLIVLKGSALIGLRDVRQGSVSFGKTDLVSLKGEALQALTIPPGVAHGFYFPEPSLLIYG